MFDIIALAITTAILQASSSGQIIPFLTNVQIIIIGQIVIGLMILFAITLQIRNMRIGKLLIRDKTIMFAGFLNKEDYERVIKEKGHLFRMVAESEVIKEVIEKEETISKPTIIEPNDIDGSLKRKED